jgi:hypothetical protein
MLEVAPSVLSDPPVTVLAPPAEVLPIVELLVVVPTVELSLAAVVPPTVPDAVVPVVAEPVVLPSVPVVPVLPTPVLCAALPVPESEDDASEQPVTQSANRTAATEAR